MKQKKDYNYYKARYLDADGNWSCIYPGCKEKGNGLIARRLHNREAHGITKTGQFCTKGDAKNSRKLFQKKNFDPTENWRVQVQLGKEHGDYDIKDRKVVKKLGAKCNVKLSQAYINNLLLDARRKAALDNAPTMAPFASRQGVKKQKQRIGGV